MQEAADRASECTRISIFHKEKKNHEDTHRAIYNILAGLYMYEACTQRMVVGCWGAVRPCCIAALPSCIFPFAPPTIAPPHCSNVDSAVCIACGTSTSFHWPTSAPRGADSILRSTPIDHLLLLDVGCATRTARREK
jgi:hypothetical protein